MADHKKWFKVWTSILTDVGFSNIRLEDVGRWTFLGAMIADHGSGGRMVIKAPATMLLNIFRCTTFGELKIALQRLPNVSIDAVKVVQNHGEDGHFSAVKQVALNDNDEFTVIIKNWRKYQLDSTGYERLKRSRSKRREDKRREDKSANRVSFSTSTAKEGPYV